MRRRSNSIPICFFSICILGFAAIPISIRVFMDLVGVEPRFYIQQLYVPALDSSHTSNNATNLNNSIFIDIEIRRVLTTVTLHYEYINVTLFHASNTSFSLASYDIPGFYAGSRSPIHRNAVVEAPGLHAISGGPKANLTMKLATKYIKHGQFYDKNRTMVVAADVPMDASGNKESKIRSRLH